MNEDLQKRLNVLDLKEQMLAEIIVWLKSRDLWENCKKDLSINIVNSKQIIKEEGIEDK